MTKKSKQMAISSLFSSKLNSAQLAKVNDVASKLNINPNWLLAVMYNETAHTFSTTITNSIGSVGLIQFTKDFSSVNYKTIGGKKYLLSDIKNMSFSQQMDLVYLYYKDVISMIKTPITSFTDCYLATFFPLAIGKNDDFILQSKSQSASLIASQNPQFNTIKDGKIYKKEVTDYFRNYYSSIFDKEINVPLTLVQTAKNNIETIATFLLLPVAVFFYSFYTINVILTN